MSTTILEPTAYIDAKSSGYFVLAENRLGEWKERGRTVSDLQSMLSRVDRDGDTYITQATFERPRRRAVNAQSVQLLFVDLDTYREPGLENKSPEELAKIVVGYCRNEGVPVPSVVVFSGRGLQPKWLLSEPVPRRRLPEWLRVQAQLVRKLRDFGSDPAAKDISRVLRLEHTLNTKSGEHARVVYEAREGTGSLVRYDFDEFFETLLGQQSEGAKRSNKRRGGLIVSAYGEFLTKKLNWARFEDLRSLWKLRGGVPVGYREVTLFWETNFMMLAEPCRADQFWGEVSALAAEIDPSDDWWKPTDLRTVFEKALKVRSGASVEIAGRFYPSLYTPQNQTLIDFFKITNEEQTRMSTIIDSDEKYRRKVAKRRANGVKPQPYGKDRPWERFGCSKSTWYRRLQRERDKVAVSPLIVHGCKLRDKACHADSTGHTSEGEAAS